MGIQHTEGIYSTAGCAEPRAGIEGACAALPGSAAAVAAAAAGPTARKAPHREPLRAHAIRWAARSTETRASEGRGGGEAGGGETKGENYEQINNREHYLYLQNVF